MFRPIGECLPSRSLKLLLILRFPSLPSLAYPLPLLPEARPASSAVRRGESGTGVLRSPVERRGIMAAEPVDESEVWDCWAAASALAVFLDNLRFKSLELPRTVDTRSWLF